MGAGHATARYRACGSLFRQRAGAPSQRTPRTTSVVTRAEAKCRSLGKSLHAWPAASARLPKKAATESYRTPCSDRTSQLSPLSDELRRSAPTADVSDPPSNGELVCAPADARAALRRAIPAVTCRASSAASAWVWASSGTRAMAGRAAASGRREGLSESDQPRASQRQRKCCCGPMTHLAHERVRGACERRIHVGGCCRRKQVDNRKGCCQEMLVAKRGEGCAAHSPARSGATRWPPGR